MAIFLTLSVFTLSFGQIQERYTQSAPEIEATKSWVAAYNAGDWDRVRASYADDVRSDHNGEVPAGHAEEEKLFDTERGRALFQRMGSLHKSMKETEGRTVPEISRPWSEN